MNYIIGIGGMSKDILNFMDIKGILHFVDDYKRGQFEGFDIIGTVDEFISLYKDMEIKPKVFNAIGSIGNNEIRNKIYEKLKGAGIKTSPIILSKSINRNVEIEDNVLINANCHIAHDCIIGESCSISPSVTLCGNVTLEPNVFIGAGAVIIQGITIGQGSIIGAGSVVLKDIPPFSKAVGNPARLI